MHHPTDRITHTTAFVTPVVEHWLEREIAQWVHHEGKTTEIMIKGTRCMGYSIQLAARHLLCAPYHRQDSI